MHIKKFTLLFLFSVLIIFAAFTVFAQEPTVGTANTDAQWAWGELTSVDVLAKTFTLKYLDYEIDQEKELVFVVDDKTVFENTKGLEELKVKDTLSIDYIPGLDNKNIAKNISLEKPDTIPAPVQPVPQLETPVVATQVVEPVAAAQPETAVAPVVQLTSEAAPNAPAEQPAVVTQESQAQ